MAAIPGCPSVIPYPSSRVPRSSSPLGVGRAFRSSRPRRRVCSPCVNDPRADQADGCTRDDQSHTGTGFLASFAVGRARTVRTTTKGGDEIEERFSPPWFHSVRPVRGDPLFPGADQADMPLVQRSVSRNRRSASTHHRSRSRKPPVSTCDFTLVGWCSCRVRRRVPSGGAHSDAECGRTRRSSNTFQRVGLPLPVADLAFQRQCPGAVTRAGPGSPSSAWYQPRLLRALP